MQKNHPTPEEQEENMYGIPVTIRIPFDLKVSIEEEVKVRKTSFSKQACALLMDGHKRAAQQSAALALALHEKEQFRQQLQKSEEEKTQLQRKIQFYEEKEAGQTEVEKKVNLILRKNRDILLHFSSSCPEATKEQLSQAGFDFYYCSNPSIAQGRPYYHVYEMCYTAKGDIITILKP